MYFYFFLYCTSNNDLTVLKVAVTIYVNATKIQMIDISKFDPLSQRLRTTETSLTDTIVTKMKYMYMQFYFR
jgi:hypothetical protein